jgi:hypothetical protein
MASAGLTVRFVDRLTARDHLWALLEYRGLGLFERLTVVVGMDGRPVVALDLGRGASRREEERLRWLVRRGRLLEEGVDDLLEEPWRWGEIYLGGGVQAFRWWQG